MGSHGLVASGAAHARNWGLDVSAHEVKRQEILARSLLELDMEEVEAELKRPTFDKSLLRAKVDGLLATLQTLILYATTVGDIARWRQDLRASAELIERVTSMDMVLDTFLLETVRFLDVQAALSLNEGTTISRSLLGTGWTENQVSARLFWWLGSTLGYWIRGLGDVAY
jgi:hypothetical protein